MVAAEPFGDVHAHGNDLVGIGGGELFDFHAAFGAADKHDFGFHRVHGDGEVDFAVDVHGLFNEEHTDVVFGFEQGLGGGLGAFGVLHDLDEPGLAASAAQHLRLEYARKSYPPGGMMPPGPLRCRGAPVGGGCGLLREPGVPLCVCCVFGKKPLCVFFFFRNLKNLRTGIRYPLICRTSSRNRPTCLHR